MIVWYGCRSHCHIPLLSSICCCLTIFVVVFWCVNAVYPLSRPISLPLAHSFLAGFIIYIQKKKMKRRLYSCCFDADYPVQERKCAHFVCECLLSMVVRRRYICFCKFNFYCYLFVRMQFSLFFAYVIRLNEISILGKRENPRWKNIVRSAKLRRP